MPKELPLNTIRSIQKDLDSSSLTFQQISEKYSISLSLVSKINHGKCHKDVEWLIMIDLPMQWPECPFRGSQEILLILKQEAERRKGK